LRAEVLVAISQRSSGSYRETNPGGSRTSGRSGIPE
jgi:hypothetical protein